MPSQTPSKVIIDTNVWISFLIGKKLQNLKDFIVNERIKLITTQQLIAELTLVTSRQKLKKYFAQDKVVELLSLINIISENVPITSIDSICRDPKDDFLLALSKKGKVDYLITGDKDLLDIKVYGKTKIVSANEFKRIFK